MPLDYLHYIFHCKGCDAPIVLHAEKLGQQFGPRGDRSKGTRNVGVACSRCKQIRNYSPDKSHPDYDPRYRVVFQPQIAETESLGLFQCASRRCVPLIRLVSAETGTMTAEEKAAEIATWIWDDFHCNAGHKIQEHEYPKPQKK